MLELADAYWEFQLREHPYVSHGQGDQRYGRDLFRESIADYARRDRLRSDFQQALATIDHARLNGQNRITFELLARELTEAREQFRFQSHLRPLLFPLGPDGMVADAIQKTAVSNPAEAEDYIARMETVPAFFADQSERLWAGLDQGFRLPGVLLQRIQGSTQSYLSSPAEKSVWFKPLARSTGTESLARSRASLCKLIEAKIRPAYRQWIDMLQEKYAVHCRDSIATRDEPDGEGFYQFLVRHYTSSELPASGIHELGHKEVRRITAGMQAIARRSGHAGDLDGMRKLLPADPRFRATSGENLREMFQILAKRIDRLIPEYFGHLPRMTFGVESVPEELAANVPPAYAQPNPPNGGTSGIFWITSLPDRCPTYLHVPLTLHEAWPGHLMHLALMQEMSNLPAFRRNGLAGYTAFIEGWGLYCEQLGHDFGLYDDPLAYYGCLEMEMWRAVRLVVDTGIHLYGWSRDQSIEYMARHLTLNLATIEAEVDRYIGMPAQALAYQIGGLKFLELRQRARSQLGESFNLRELHDRFMDAGPVTLGLLDTHVQTWIDSCRDASERSAK
ncbi:MAG: DUF885 domain-containing protein [Lysobacterales bacterium]